MNQTNYIFPIPEIEQIILNYLDIDMLYQNVLFVNKYFYELIIQDPLYSEFKKFNDRRSFGEMNVNYCIVKACKYDCLLVAKYFFEKFNDEYIENRHLEKSFSHCCKNKNEDGVKWIYKLNKDFGIDIDIEFALSRICEYGILSLVDWICKIILQTNNPVDIHIFKNSFWCACRTGHLQIVKYLYSFRDKISINVRGYNQAFYLSCANGHMPIARYLHKISLKEGKKINIHYRHEKPFLSSCGNGHLETAQYLYELSVKQNNEIDIHVNNDESFHSSCCNGHLEVAQWLYYLDQDYSFEINENLFLACCGNGSLEIIKWFYSLGINYVYGINSCIPRAFQLSCITGHLDMAKYLYSSEQIDIHLKKEKVFRTVCHNGHMEIVKWLYQLDSHNKIDIHVKNENAFRKACVYNNINIVKYLFSIEEDNKIDIRAKNDYAFRVSCRKTKRNCRVEFMVDNYSNLEIIKLLASLCKDYVPEIKTHIKYLNKYDSYITTRNGYFEVEKLLLSLQNKNQLKIIGEHLINYEIIQSS